MSARIAYCVSSHGFGHAARACAIMEALREQRPQLKIDIYSTVPEWFFADSLGAGVDYMPLETDVGLVQSTSLEEDLEATVERLRFRPPWSEACVEATTRTLIDSGCRAVVCDLAPLGLVAGRAARVPTFLVQSFTWDWIYAGYRALCPKLAEIGRTLTPVFASASLSIETEPACQHVPGAIVVPPVSRRPRRDRRWVRDHLGIPCSAPVVLLTMGGIPWVHHQLTSLQAHSDAFFIVPGAASSLVREGRLLRLPRHSVLYHPDLVHASDLVVGKLGYSTVAEAYHADVAFAYIARSRFPETPILESFVRDEMKAHEISVEELESMAWVDRLAAFLAGTGASQPRSNGASVAAAEILEAARL